MSCRHENRVYNGENIQAIFTKPNWPVGRNAVYSFGRQATCRDCGAHLIEHDKSFNYPAKVTQLDYQP